MFFFIILGYGRREVVELLIAAGAALQARDDGGLQPLHNACSFGHADVVRALLAAGAAPAARDNWGYTPLHEAAAKGKVDVCTGERETEVYSVTWRLVPASQEWT